MFYLKAKGADPFSSFTQSLVTSIYYVRLGHCLLTFISWQVISLKCHIKPCVNHPQAQSAKAFIPIAQTILQS